VGRLFLVDAMLYNIWTLAIYSFLGCRC